METTINGLRVFTNGNKENQAIIFIHGFPYDHTMWDSQVAALSDEYFCVSYDIRGLGKSYVGDGQYTMEAYIWDLFSIIDKLNLEKPIICGLSMGGYISFRAVEARQELFGGLILCDTRSESDDNAGKIKRSLAINKINTEGLEAFVSEFIPNCFHPKTPKRLSEMYNRIFDITKNQNPTGVKGALIAMLSRKDTTKSLKKINIPTLVLVGTKDALTPPDVMKGIANKIKKSEFRKISKAGHMTPLENPEMVNYYIRKFLGKNF
ncbi:MAG: alpha/beta hydrolase [Ignavibacteriae bacterium]|nr:MAG: alpha/beta hydrolase [Ignavibacteriota bacterium]